MLNSKVLNVKMLNRKKAPGKLEHRQTILSKRSLANKMSKTDKFGN